MNNEIVASLWAEKIVMGNSTLSYKSVSVRIQKCIPYCINKQGIPLYQKVDFVIFLQARPPISKPFLPSLFSSLTLTFFLFLVNWVFINISIWQSDFIVLTWIFRMTCFVSLCTTSFLHFYYKSTVFRLHVYTCVYKSKQVNFLDKRFIPFSFI